MNATSNSQSGWNRFLICVNDSGRDFFHILWLIRFSVLASLIASVALFLPGQSAEALRALAEDAPSAALVGLGLAAIILTLAIWYFARVILYALLPCEKRFEYLADTRTPESSVAEMKVTGIGKWSVNNLPRIAGILPLVAIGASFLAARIQTISEPATEFADANNRLFWLGVTAIGVAGLIYASFVMRRNRISKKSGLGNKAQGYTENGQIGGLRCSTRWLLGISALLSLLLLILFSSGVRAARFGPSFGPLAIVMLAGAAWIPLGSYLVYETRRTHIPIIAAIIAVTLVINAAGLNENHRVRLVERGAFAKFETNGSFATWLKSRPDIEAFAGTDYPVVVVAAEGGGIRAAYQTALLLSAIQDRSPLFADHLFAISSASGGSIGAAVFASLVHDFSETTPHRSAPRAPGTPDSWSYKSDRILSNDLLSPSLAMYLFPEALQQVIPTPIYNFDRSAGMDFALEQNWLDATKDNLFAQPLAALYDKGPRGSVPKLFLNTTNVESGDRMVVSDFSTTNSSFNKLVSFADLGTDSVISISAAAGLSARFSYISPSGYIDVKGAMGTGRRRFVDGGYFENSGLATLENIIAFMRQDTVEVPASGGSTSSTNSSRNPKVLPRFKVIVIRIGFEPMTERPGIGSQRSPEMAPVFEDALAPVEALLHTRDARGRYAINRMPGPYARLEPIAKGDEHAEFVFNDGRRPLPLAWIFSDSARSEIKRQIYGTPATGTGTPSMSALIETLTEQLKGKKKST